VGLLVLVALLFVWFMPARWVLPRIEPRLHGLQLQQLQGTVWNGSAGQLRGADGHVLGRLQWHLSRLALLGKMRLQVDLEGPQLGLAAMIRRSSADQIELSEVTLRAGLNLLDQRTTSPFGQPRGELQLHIEHALLQGGWPLQLQAEAHWHDAAMQTKNGLVALGELSAQAQAQGGIVQAQLHDDGKGPLQVDGQLQVIPLGWRLDATLLARTADPALHRWLQQLGQPDSAGRVHIQRKGGLASGSSTPAVADHTTGKP
jgi:general secretion pathway protein N